MPDDLTVSTVLRCLDGATRRHLEMVMDDGMDYAKLKDKLILLDKNTKAWSGDNFLKNLQVFNQPPSSSSTYQGPAPMEVDQVQYGNKGKSKGKSKSKGKKGGWFGFPYAGGGHKGSNKGKSKQKGKKGNKGKSKGTHQKGKGYSSGNNNTCRICGEYGHWGHECPLKSRVNQVAGAGAVSSEPQGQGVPTDATSTTGSVSTRRTSASSATSSALSSASKSVRLVKMYNVATPPAEQPELYEMRSDLEDDCND